MNRAEVEALLARHNGILAAAPSDLIDFTSYRDDGTPYLEIDDAGRGHWKSSERGELLADKVTDDPDELAYWAFQSVTWTLAARWELDHRRPAEDSRIQLFRYQNQLLSSLNQLWAARFRRELREMFAETGDQPEDIATIPTP